MGGNAKRTQRYGGREMEEREWRKDLQGQRLGHSQTHAGGAQINGYFSAFTTALVTSLLVSTDYRNKFTIISLQTKLDAHVNTSTHTHTEMVSHSLQCCSNHQISSFPFLTLGCLISIKLIYSDTVTWSSSHFNISYLPEAKARQLLRQPFCHPGSRVFGCIHTGHCCCNRAQTRPSTLPYRPVLSLCLMIQARECFSMSQQHLNATLTAYFCFLYAQTCI